MHIIDLILDQPFVWGLFVIYLVGTSYLAWLGHKRTTDIKSFALGDGKMNPWIVGLTLAASIASTATFVINPGLVYAFGVSAFLHYGLAVVLGVVTALVLLSIGFRRVGAESGALTLPQWIGQRYNSKALSVFFAMASLLSLTFVVLILGGVSIVMQKVLGLGNTECLVIVTVFVFGYIFVGGTYAHAYTNTMQASIMIVVALIIIISGLDSFSEGMGPFLDRIRAVDPNLAMATNASNGFFDSAFKVYGAGFIVGFAVVCQPHILSKALYVKDDRDVRRYLGVTIAVTIVFTGLLLVGLYVRAGDFPQDLKYDTVMAVYIAETFSGPLLAFISVALVAAGMSTLDGILVALSSIAANDLFLGLTEDNLLKNRSESQKAALAHRASQIILVVMGAIAFTIALNPPELLGFFGQLGVYGLVAASTPPVLFGVLMSGAGRQIPKHWMLFASVSAMGVHFVLYLWGGVINPAVSASCGVMAGIALILLQCTKTLLTRSQHEPRL
jgi:SSS family solute:Na+ symporter/sodium/pantothenate symporter